MKIEKILFKGTKTLRSIHFRFDTYGVYLLFIEGHQLMAGITYQWPTFIQRKNGEFAAQHIRPGLNCFSWDYEIVQFEPGYNGVENSK